MITKITMHEIHLRYKGTLSTGKKYRYCQLCRVVYEYDTVKKKRKLISGRVEKERTEMTQVGIDGLVQGFNKKGTMRKKIVH